MLIRIPKSVVSFGGLFLAVGVLILAIPRAAHAVAVAAALVQVTNTVASPAVAQSPNSQAAQLVELFAIVDPGNALGQGFAAVQAGRQISSQYSVPNSQSLVITAVDVTPPGNCASGSFGVKLSSSGILPIWTASAPNTGHFEYPSGIVFPPGVVPGIQATFTNNIGGTFCKEAVTVQLYGYLTFN
jgi:hypothetical protein